MDLAVEMLDTADLRTFHKNPRKGSVQTIAESLDRNGQYRAIVVNRGTHTGRPNEVLAGNHTFLAAKQLGWQAIAAHVIDVTDDQANRIVLVDNRSSDIATNDDDMLIVLLDELGGDLEGTGFNRDDLSALLDDVEPDIEPMETESYDLIVSCRSASQQEDLHEKLTAEGFECRIRNP